MSGVPGQNAYALDESHVEDCPTAKVTHDKQIQILMFVRGCLLAAKRAGGG